MYNYKSFCMGDNILSDGLMEYPEIERVESDCQVSSLSLPIIYMLIRCVIYMLMRCMLTRLTKWVYNQTGYALRPIRGNIYYYRNVH